MSYAWKLVSAPEGAEVILSSANKPTTTISGSVEGEYTVRFTVSDGELSATAELTVTLKKALRAASARTSLRTPLPSKVTTPPAGRT